MATSVAPNVHGAYRRAKSLRPPHRSRLVPATGHRCDGLADASALGTAQHSLLLRD